MSLPGSPLWIPPTGSLDLSDAGFLRDPTVIFADPSELRTLPDLGNYRALVLLGEPGISKSTTLKDLRGQFNSFTIKAIGRPCANSRGATSGRRPPVRVITWQTQISNSPIVR